MSDVVSDEEFQKIMNIEQRFAKNSNESLNLNQRHTLNSILKPKFQIGSDSASARNLGRQSKEKRADAKSNKRVSFAERLLSQTHSIDVERKSVRKSRRSILKNAKKEANSAKINKND